VSEPGEMWAGRLDQAPMTIYAVRPWVGNKPPGDELPPEPDEPDAEEDPKGHE
jgi:hypothetical protein